MKNIVLVRPGYSDRIYGAVYEQNKNTRREIRPPLGLMALAGYLKMFGHRVSIVDGEPELLSVDDTVARALKLRPHVLGVTATTPEYPFASRILRKIKQADGSIETVLGGAHITNLPEYTVDDLAGDLDWGVLYEGEKPMAAIAAGDARDFCWKPELSPKLLMAQERLSGPELDAFMPDRDCLDMSQYRYVDSTAGLVQNDAIEMARGCPFGCVFCTSRRTLMESRRISSVVDEIESSAARFHTKLFMFFDDTFTINRDRATELFWEIIRKKRRGWLAQDVHFYGFTRANTLDFELLKLMREAGCDKISIGVETGNAEILRAMQKGTKLADYRTAYKMIDELGIVKRGSFIIGHPYETESTIRDSIDFAIELDLDEIGVNIMTPYPGQVTFRHAYDAKGIWFAHEIHYAELRERKRLADTWNDFRQVNWHDYWMQHLRWGKAVVETGALSREALIYWHGRFLQEVYGSDRMSARRLRQIECGSNDDYWHRPWRVHSDRNRRRLEREQERKPSFPEPLHRAHTYQPLFLRDYQKNELYLTPARRAGARAVEARGAAE